MKRFVVLLLALTMIFALAACGKGGKTMECEGCGQTKTCKEVTFMGETGWLCSDCEKLLDSLSDLAALAG